MSLSEISDSKIIHLQSDLFEIPADVTYLNCASMSPQLRSVTAAGFASVSSKVTPWTIDWFSDSEKLRDLAAKIVNADADSIALIPSASYGLAVAAANVKVEKGQNIVLLHEEFPSNYYIWEKLARTKEAQIRLVKRAENEAWTLSILNSIDEKTAVVSVPNCHWTDGSLIELERVAEKTRSVGAALVIDASQSLGAYPLDAKKIKPDFLVSVGYKWLLCPYSLGFLYADEKWRTEGKPIEESWLTRADSENFATLVAYRSEYRTGARRFDMGEFTNFVTVPMAIAALQQIHEWKVENIQQTLAVLTRLIAKKAEELGCRMLPENDRINHLIGIKLPNGIPAGFSEQMAQNKIFVSLRGEAIRIAPYLYNDEADIEKFFEVLQKLI